MPASDSAPTPAAPRHRAIFTIASWAAPAVVGLATYVVYQYAVNHRANGDWLPGVGEALIGAAIMAALGFGLGLTALLRRERQSWLAILPCLAGFGLLAYFGYNLLRNTFSSHF